MKSLIQCVPNFSEGLRSEVIESIVEAIRSTPHVRLADWSADGDHNRMVATFIGEPEPIRKAALAAAAVAIERIHVPKHIGVHPRLGALDVLPLVPLTGITLEECARIATDLAGEISNNFALPVFLYEASSHSGHTLPQIRREAFKTLSPDIGPNIPHPTAGASVVGARMPLIAYNINLATTEVEHAKTIARELRSEGRADFLGIRALGLPLTSRGMTQVSMNITHPEATRLFDVYRYVAQRASELGIEVIGSEVIGAIPGFTGFEIIEDALKTIRLKPGQVLLENWPLNV